MEGAPAFTYWVELHSNISPFANNFGETDLAKNWQEATGVKLTFEHPSGTSRDQQLESLNIMFASGKYADMIYYDWNNYPGGASKLFDDGIIYSLKDAIDQWMPDLAVYINDDTWGRLCKEDDRSIFKIPMLLENEFLVSTSGPMLRGDLLKKYNLEVPETIADWDAYLDAIKGDVETPFMQIFTDLSATFARTYDAPIDFINDNGTVKYGPAQPTYKDFLTQLNNWYERGLYDRNFTTTDRKALDAAMSAGTAGACRGSGGQQLGAYVPLLQANIPGADIVPAPYPVLEKGQLIRHNGNWLARSSGAVITKNVSEANLEYAAKFLNYNYTEEGNRLVNYGVEGVTYNVVNGVPTYTETITRPSDGKTFAQALSCWTFSNWAGPFVQNEDYLVQYYELPQQKQALVEWNRFDGTSQDLTRVTLTSEEAGEFGRLYNDIRSYTEECTQLFIKGDKALAEYDTFVTEIEGMGLARCIELRQAALDRFNAR